MDLEPNIINHEMLETAIKEQSKRGEVIRLNEGNRFDFNSVLKIRLEFQNILKIDHLWMLKNLTKLSLNYNKIDTIENLDTLTQLKELDLSFNYIEKIDSLDPLVNLEVLSLFSNRIEVIENMNQLRKLMILNIGVNHIKTMAGFERLRFLPLKVFNMEGNPVGESINLRQYVSAFLPKIKYYNYIYVTPKEKEEAAIEYSRELRELKETESKEIHEIQGQQRLSDEAKHYHQCFVESLDGHQLFQRLFDGGKLPQFKNGIEEVKRRLQDDMFCLTQRIFQIGLDRFEEREKEVKSFRVCLVNAKRLNQQKGQRLINDLNRRSEMRKPSDMGPLIEETWQKLMAMEVQLFEDIEDVTKTFGFIMADLINDFIKDVQSLFFQIKELVDNLYAILMDRVKDKQSLIGDSSSTTEAIQDLWKYQKCVINERMIQLQERAREYEVNLLDSFKEDEIERNRKKIIEINYFLDTMRGEEQPSKVDPNLPNDKIVAHAGAEQQQIDKL